MSGYDIVRYPLEGVFRASDSPPNAAMEITDENGEATETFDEDLPPAHSYLGDNLESVSGRVILSEGSFTSLPLLPRSYGTLLPGQTFPLAVRDVSRTSMLRDCVEGNHTFGCVANRYHQCQEADVEIYGTTAEIYEFCSDIDTVCIRAKGRQRFRLINTRRSNGGYLIGDVEILPEIILPKPLSNLHYSSLSRVRGTHKAKCGHREAQLTHWPKWVYDQYDVDKVMDRVDKELSFLKQGLRKEKGRQAWPKDPSELSFWLATHLDAEDRLFIIKLNSPIQRLRWLLSLMGKCQQQFNCQSCKVQIGLQQDVFAMSTEGTQSTYVNPEGFLHDILTFLHAQNVALTSLPSSQFSWFPGYAWSIAVCSSCHRHIGWQFTSLSPRLKPKKFWGLTRHSLITVPKLDRDKDEDNFKPVI
ncbi:protein cereblon isoform X2 [Cimex lectularius]|nr:protein cereblon isoform X2 [Cimex lectularius]XP_014241908.1 protein cereblon isoform X2 [Cimex lectularius]